MAEPLKGLRAIEFGQLLAGPVHGHAARRLRRRRDQGRAARHRRRDARLGPAAPQRPQPVVDDPGPQQALASRSTCASPRARRSPIELAADGGHRPRELPPRHDGEVGPRAGGRPRPQPEGHLRPRLRLRADRPLRAPPRLRLRRRGHQRPAPHQRLPRPGAAARRHLLRRHARRAVRVPGHPARALRARTAAPRARWSTRASSTRASR